jgi:hypothetical protein
MGRKMDNKIAPTTVPMKMTSTGSIREVKVVMLASICCS